MNSETTYNVRKDLYTCVTTFTGQLEKALNATTLHDPQNLILGRPKATLSLLREEGMKDLLVAAGDLKVHRYRVVLDGCISPVNFRLRDPLPTGGKEEWLEAWDRSFEVDNAARKVREVREEQGLPLLFARTGTIAAARVRSFAKEDGATVSIIKPEGSPYPEDSLLTDFGSHELPMTSFGSPCDGTFRADQLASEISRIFPESGPGEPRTHLVGSLRQLLHHAIRAGRQFEAPSLLDSGPVSSPESKTESGPVIPSDTGSYLGVLTEDAQLVDRNNDIPNGRSLTKGSVVLVHTGSLYQPRILGSVSHPNKGTPELELERNFCQTLASSLSQITDMADRLTGKALVEAIVDALETLTSHTNYGSSVLPNYREN